MLRETAATVAMARRTTHGWSAANGQRDVSKWYVEMEEQTPGSLTCGSSTIQKFLGAQERDASAQKALQNTPITKRAWHPWSEVRAAAQKAVMHLYLPTLVDAVSVLTKATL